MLYLFFSVFVNYNVLLVFLFSFHLFSDNSYFALYIFTFCSLCLRYSFSLYSLFLPLSRYLPSFFSSIVHVIYLSLFLSYSDISSFSFSVYLFHSFLFIPSLFPAVSFLLSLSVILRLSVYTYLYHCLQLFPFIFSRLFLPFYLSITHTFLLFVNYLFISVHFPWPFPAFSFSPSLFLSFISSISNFPSHSLHLSFSLQ